MKKNDSKHKNETIEEEVKRLRKEIAKVKSQKESEKAKLKAKLAAARKELKKKDVETVTLTEEQQKLLSKLFPDIDSLF